MPVKKGSKKKGSRSASPKKPARPSLPVNEDPVLPRTVGTRSVSVHVRGITWSVLDYTMQLTWTHRVIDLMTMISNRHGNSVTGLVLYKDEIHPRNLLSDPMQLIQDLLPLREASRPDEEELVIFYDFKPHDSDCALLLSTPRNFKIEAQQRQEQEQLDQQRLRRQQQVGNRNSLDSNADSARAIQNAATMSKAPFARKSYLAGP